MRGTLAEARRAGAGAIFFTCNPSSAQEVEADVKIVPLVGPEVITGSTRMKAGTATKMVLNMITTAAMIRVGKVYGNLMVDLTPSCLKLEDRATRILMAVEDLPEKEARRTLSEARWDLKAAIVMRKRGVGYDQALEYLRKADGIVKKALVG